MANRACCVSFANLSVDLTFFFGSTTIVASPDVDEQTRKRDKLVDRIKVVEAYAGHTRLVIGLSARPRWIFPRPCRPCCHSSTPPIKGNF